MNGFINVLKPPGMSSHDVVSFIRRTYQLKKVGHAGTLDPGAAGVLPIALGKATRLIEYMADADKSYRAELTFGLSTDTGDDTGNILIQQNDFIMPAQAEVEAVLASFKGCIEQVPPMYSALKVNGEKLYDLARKGITVERKARIININEIALIKYDAAAKKIMFDVECSKGTYIRTLCMDIGERLALPATMSFLIRTRVGSFTLIEAKSLEELQAEAPAGLLPIDCVVSHLPKIILAGEKALGFQQGKKLARLGVSFADDTLCRIYNDDKFIGIGKMQRNVLVPEKVFPE